MQALPGLVPGFDMDAAVQDQALQQMAHEFISGAVKLGCGVVRRRGSTQLEARDMIAYMEQNWCALVQHVTAMLDAMLDARHEIASAA